MPPHASTPSNAQLSSTARTGSRRRHLLSSFLAATLLLSSSASASASFHVQSVLGREERVLSWDHHPLMPLPPPSTKWDASTSLLLNSNQASSSSSSSAGRSIHDNLHSHRHAHQHHLASRRLLKRQDSSSSSAPLSADNEATQSSKEEEQVATLSPSSTSLSSASLLASSTGTTSGANALATEDASTTTSKTLPRADTDLPIPDPFPKPFDTTLSLNFSTSCLSFFASFLSSSKFSTCRPFSFLLPSSSGFATLTRSGNLTDLSAVVSATLGVEEGEGCEVWMEGMGGVMKSKCGQDLTEDNAVAKQALNGFETYALMRNATELVDDDSGAYCYVDSVSQSTADDLFLWSLYTGQALPSTSTPSCSTCSKALLSTYAAQASNGSLALSGVYDAAVQRVNAQCGQGWALSVEVVSGAERRRQTAGWGGLVGVGVLGVGLGVML